MAKLLKKDQLVMALNHAKKKMFFCQKHFFFLCSLCRRPLQKTQVKIVGACEEECFTTFVPNLTTVQLLFRLRGDANQLWNVVLFFQVFSHSSVWTFRDDIDENLKHTKLQRFNAQSKISEFIEQSISKQRRSRMQTKMNMFQFLQMWKYNRRRFQRQMDGWM